jgi:ABC-type sugar transport system substrate-binding protein
MSTRLAALLLALAFTILPAASRAQTKHLRIGISLYSQTIPLYIEMRKGMEDEAAKRGIDLTFQYSGPDAQQQSDQIANFVTTKVDLILCSPFDKNALVNAYKQARAAGIPMISVANTIASPADEDAYIGYDLSKPGVLEMNAVAKGIQGSGPIGIIEGPPTIAFVYGWHQGVTRVLAANPNIKAVADINGALTRAAGLDAAANILTAHPDVKAIVAVSDELAEGAAQAIKERNIAPGKIFVAGYDGYPDVVQMIKTHGGIDYTLGLRGYTFGKIAIDTAADFLAGKKPKTHVIEPPTVEVTHDNVNSLTADDLR